MLSFQTTTKNQIDAFLSHPSHAILLGGPEGSGKYYTAQYIASRLLETNIEKILSHPNLKIIKPDKSSLGIDQIREMQKFLRLVTPGSQEIRRVVIITDAHFMTIEAQNALLKSLEEPPSDTIIILTVSISQKLKDTIYSRVQQIPILPVDKKNALKTFGQDFIDNEIHKAYMLSGGRLGLMHALLHDKEHRLTKEIVRVKKILTTSRYQRLLSLDELIQQKDQIVYFLQACKLICSAAFHQAVVKKDNTQAKQWLNALSTIYDTEASLSHNPNTRLMLINLMLHF